MTKQEEIMNWAFVFFRPVFRTDEVTEAYINDFFRGLSQRGEVIKVERELPKNPYLFEEPTYSIVQMVDGWMHKGYENAQQDMLKAGYVAVKPLIKDVKADAKQT